MRKILKQIFDMFVATVCCFIQLVGLVFASIAMMFGRCGEILEGFSAGILEIAKSVTDDAEKTTPV
jgi:zinc transporter ZupT